MVIEGTSVDEVEHRIDDRSPIDDRLKLACVPYRAVGLSTPTVADAPRSYSVLPNTGSG